MPSIRALCSLTAVALVGAVVGLAPAAHAAEAADKQNYGTVIGIDLGTTYSCVGGRRTGSRLACALASRPKN